MSLEQRRKEMIVIIEEAVFDCGGRHIDPEAIINAIGKIEDLK